MAEENKETAGSRVEEEEEEEEEEFVPGFETLEDYSKALLSLVVQATKSANALPAEGDDFDYYASFPGFKTFCAKMGARVNKSISKLMRHQQLPCYWPSGGGGGGAGGGAPTVEDLEERFETLVEANDVLLERVGILLDEASGVKKEQPVLPSALQQGTAEVASWNKKKDSVREAVASYKFIHAKNVQRPQLQFQDKIDNSSASFIPLLREKPNALKPLPETFQRLQNPTSLNALIANAKEWASSDQRFEHPYQYELDHLEPREEQLQLREPEPPGSLEDTPLTYVTTPQQLQELKEKLCSVSEFAVDLEHHSYRSYQGFVCLMQVSTRDHDYIIDALELRQNMHVLLDPFTNPAIVKVLHGADWDILWLQRDFGIYVVNLFDTGQASRVLSLPRFSLAFLLQYCCDVQADKQYQLADWRIRPLPPELSKYAREDTHYLLYIYDRMRNELLRRGNKQNNLLRSVLDRSRDICLKTYKKPVFSEDGYLYLYNKHKRTFNSQQLHCLRLLYAWRDRVAREEDESTGYVLPNHMLFQISEILPREPQGLLACCNPIPTLLRTHLQELYMLVQQAREAPLSDRLPTPVIPATVSSPAQLHQDHTPLATPTPEDEPDTTTGALYTTRLIATGEPVGVAKPVISAFRDVQLDLTQSTQKKLEMIRSSFPDILSKFLEARIMTPSEVILRQKLSDTTGKATPTSTPGTPAASGAPSESPLVKKETSPAPATTADMPTGSQKTNAVTERVSLPAGVKGKDKRKMGNPLPGGKRKWGSTAKGEEEVGGAAARKKPREGEEEWAFDYGAVHFTDFTDDAPTPAVFSPHDQEDGRRRHSGPRSRVHQKSGERSHTYTQGRNTSKQQSWPRSHQ